MRLPRSTSRDSGAIDDQAIEDRRAAVLGVQHLRIELGPNCCRAVTRSRCATSNSCCVIGTPSTVASAPSPDTKLL